MGRKKSPLNYTFSQKEDSTDINNEERWMQSMLTGAYVHDASDEVDSTPKRRIILMLVCSLLLFGLLGARLFLIQSVSGEELSKLAQGNRIREIVEYAPRGRILDVNGRELATNTLSFQLSATPFLVETEVEEFKKDTEMIGKVLNIESQAVDKIIKSSKSPENQPVVIAGNLTHKQALKLEAIIKDAKGFSVDQIPVREYNPKWGLAHIVGYTGRVSEEDLKNSKNKDLIPTDFIGKAGIENYYDEYLRGKNGWRRIEVDALGKPVRVLGKKDPVPGKDLKLSIDIKIQEAMWNGAHEQMAKANVSRAAGVAVNPQDGHVIAMVSIPAYDNNLFSKGIGHKDFNKLNKDPNQPLFNKAVSGGYTTGSIIKPLVASAALQEGVVDENTVIVDRGYIDVTSQYDPGQYFRFEGWRPEGLGPMNVRRAIAWSSNIYFYTVGGGHDNIEGLGEKRLVEAYRHFGLGDQTGINLNNETFGRVPDEKWKLENKNEPWFVGDTYNISIGQGDLLISPLQIMMAHVAIANNGFLLKPSLVASDERVVKHELKYDKKYLQMVREGMRQVLTDGTTCECTFKDVPVIVAGKSGTAETNTPGGRRPHAWFTAFAPYEKPEISVTMFLDEGVGGSQFSAPVIAKTLNAYFTE